MLSPIGVRLLHSNPLCCPRHRSAAPLTRPRLLLWCVQSDESQVNALTQENPIAPGLLDETLSRMSHCVVGMIDRCSETMELFSFFLPWMRYNCTANEDRIWDTRVKGLPEDVAKAFLHVNALDEHVFQFGSKLFDAQLKEARKARAVAEPAASVSVATTAVSVAASTITLAAAAVAEPAATAVSAAAVSVAAAALAQPAAAVSAAAVALAAFTVAAASVALTTAAVAEPAAVAAPASAEPRAPHLKHAPLAVVLCGV